MAGYRLTGDPQWDEAMRAEYRQSAEAGRMLFDACQAGDAEFFFQAIDAVNGSTDGWSHGLRRLVRGQTVNPAVPALFLEVWIQSRHLPLKIGNRALTAAALRLLMPRGYSGGPSMLYRGTRRRERSRRLYGFSWTTDQAVARRFAEHWSDAFGDGVILETTAPAEAIFILRTDMEHYDEREAIVDPYRLGHVKVAGDIARRP